MFTKLLLVAAAAFTYGSNLTLKVPHTPNKFIDNEYPSFRVGDYEITQLEHISAAAGQVRFNRLQVILPHVVFETLGKYENVYIFIPNYDYNKSVSLYMRMDFYIEDIYDSSAYYDMEEIPLSEAMLTILPYTIVDLPIKYNIFDSRNWDHYMNEEFRLTFIVPYTEHMQPSAPIVEELRNITLFTQRSDGAVGSYDYGYNDGYDNGYQEGYEEAVLSADGSWLGSLVFGTIGGIVGLLFTISDFEVLGVSIMSIITLFVAIGIIMLLIKVLK